MRFFVFLSIPLLFVSCGKTPDWSHLDLPDSEYGTAFRFEGSRWIEIDDSGPMIVGEKTCKTSGAVLQALESPDPKEGLVSAELCFAADGNAKCEMLVGILNEAKKRPGWTDLRSIAFTIVTKFPKRPDERGVLRFRLRMPREHGVAIDVMLVEMGADGSIVLNGEVRSPAEQRSKLGDYATAAKMTGSSPALVLSFDRDVSVSDFVEILGFCSAAGITEFWHIRLN